MTLTIAQIAASATDDELFKLLSAELTDRLGSSEGGDLDAFLDRAAALPVGLRAMAMTYQLDVSLTLDDLGWHFANWHHRRYCEATLWALGELEARELANLFGEAYVIADRYWDEIGRLIARDFEAFVEWYSESEFEKETMPLTRRMWALQKEKTILGYWPSYARRYPERVAEAGDDRL